MYLSSICLSEGFFKIKSFLGLKNLCFNWRDYQRSICRGNIMSYCVFCIWKDNEINLKKEKRKKIIYIPTLSVVAEYKYIYKSFKNWCFDLYVAEASIFLLHNEQCYVTNEYIVPWLLIVTNCYTSVCKLCIVA
jgi:hypothetical protein